MIPVLARPGGGRATIAFALALALAGVALAVGAAITGPGGARALAPCEAHSNSGEELDLLVQLQGWRDASIPGSYHLTVSTPLNFAAAGYARFLADAPGAAGHYADGGAAGRAWADRAIVCGYPASSAAGGEALAVVESSGPVSVGPAQALSIMTASPGGGAYTPANVGLPTRCVGVAKATSANGRKVAWVVLLFGASGNCPQSAVGAYPPSPSPSEAAASPSPTATKTPAATPTPSDPRPNKRYVAVVARDVDAPAAPTITIPVITPTPSPGSGACGGTTARITALNKLSETVVVTGAGDLTGWFIVSELGEQRFNFPAAFVLNGAATILSGRDKFEHTATTLWWSAGTVWNNTLDDDAFLYDCTGQLVSVMDDGV